MRSLVFILPIALLLTGCGTRVYQTADGRYVKTVPCGNGTNTAIGVGGGALVGGFLGRESGGRHNRIGRTLGGAALGAVAGGVLGAASEQRCAVEVNPPGYGNPGYGYGGPVLAQPVQGYGVTQYNRTQVEITRAPVYAPEPSFEYPVNGYGNGYSRNVYPSDGYGYQGAPVNGYSGGYRGPRAEYVD